MTLTTLPRNAIGDRAGPRYQLKTFRSRLRAAEPGAKVDLHERGGSSPVSDPREARRRPGALHRSRTRHQVQVTGFKVIASSGMAGVIVDRRVHLREDIAAASIELPADTVEELDRIGTR